MAARGMIYPSICSSKKKLDRHHRKETNKQDNKIISVLQFPFHQIEARKFLTVDHRPRLST
jgi:hypothetical protein